MPYSTDHSFSKAASECFREIGEHMFVNPISSYPWGGRPRVISRIAIFEKYLRGEDVIKAAWLQKQAIREYQLTPEWTNRVVGSGIPAGMTKTEYVGIEYLIALLDQRSEGKWRAEADAIWKASPTTMDYAREAFGEPTQEQFTTWRNDWALQRRAEMRAIEDVGSKVGSEPPQAGVKKESFRPVVASGPTLTIKAGTSVFHGTNEDDRGFDETYDALRGPAWVSLSPSVAQIFALRNMEADSEMFPRINEVFPRIIEYRLVEDIELPMIANRLAMDEFIEQRRIVTNSTKDIRESVVRAGIAGWVVPNGYPDGDDILIVDTRCLQYVGTQLLMTAEQYERRYAEMQEVEAIVLSDQATDGACFRLDSLVNRLHQAPWRMHETLGVISVDEMRAAETPDDIAVPRM